MAFSSSSASRNWSYDVFPSFSGQDVRKTFLSHFLKELNQKLIIPFRDNEIEKSQSLDPVLKQAIRDSRIAVVIFSTNYASSSWCLNELLEIVKCKKQIIPIFYRLDPSHVRKQTGDFGKIFEKTCRNKTEDEIIRWQRALTDVANILGYHTVTWDNEASMIETVTNDLLSKLHSSPSNEFDEDFVGIEDHIIKMMSLLKLESEEVKMVGIWGSSGIGKTTIARALFTRLSCQFQSSLFIDRAFISKSTEVYSSRVNLVDYNMKLHLQRAFLAELLDKKDFKIDHIGAIEKLLKHRKALIFIDDVDDQDVLDALAGSNQWFGSGSRIVVVTKDKHFLRAHGIDNIYEVCLPSKDLALEMFCRSAFRENSPPDGFMELTSEVVLRAGNLPLGLKVLGSHLRGRDKEDWTDMLPRLRNGLDKKIEKTLRISYDGLNNKDAAIFRHIACLFNGETVDDIKQLLADSKLDVNIGIKNLLDKSLIHERWNTVEMHSLLQEMGKEIVRSQSDKPGEREFLTDPEDICKVLENNIGTEKILGIALDIDETGELHIHESAFKSMHNLLFLKLYSKKWGQEKAMRWHLPERFDHFASNSKLRLLIWEKYPMRCMPSNFCPQNLVKLVMRDSNLEKLWEGVHPLTGLKKMDLTFSRNLKEIPNLSMATNLETLYLDWCSSLVELPSSTQYLNKLIELVMSHCNNLESLPAGINLKSLYRLDLNGCSLLRRFPDISTNISVLDISDTAIEDIPSNFRLENLSKLAIWGMTSEKLWGRVQPLTTIGMLSPSLTTLTLSDIPSLVELPSSIQDLYQLEFLIIFNCVNLEILPSGINLDSLDCLHLSGCKRLKTFPDISRNISELRLNYTAVEEVPWWIEKFSKLSWLRMKGCKYLRRVSLNIFKLKRLEEVYFSDCRALTEASFDDSPSDNIHSNLQVPDDKADDCFSVVQLNLINSFNFDPKALIQQQMRSMTLIMLGEEVPSYFTHRTTGNSLTNIALPHNSASQPFFSCWCCAVIDTESNPSDFSSFEIEVCCRFINRHGNHFDSAYYMPQFFSTSALGGHVIIFDCWFRVIHEDTTLLDGQLNYDHVDIQFRLIDIEDSQVKLKGCGIQRIDDYTVPDNWPGNSNILPHVCERDQSNTINSGSHETEPSQECGDSRKSRKMVRILKKLLSCYAQDA